MIKGSSDHEPSDLELTAARESLCVWQTPHAFITKVRSFAPLVKSSTLFNKANAGFLLDALPVAEFVQLRPVDAVRLAAQQERLNDGQLRLGEVVIDIEVTEVLAPGRRRGDEYRCGARQSGSVDFDPNLGNTIAKALAAGVKRKVERNYPSKPLLLVYLNICSGGKLGNEVDAAIRQLKTEYSKSFPEICVLWRGRLY